MSALTRETLGTLARRTLRHLLGGKRRLHTLRRLFFRVIGSPTAELLLSQASLPRDADVRIRVRVRPVLNGRATLRVLWTDVHHRIVHEGTHEITPDNAGELAFSLDLRRARAMKNVIRIDLSANGRRASATAEFVAQPEGAWRDWIVMMWNPYPSADIPLLKSIGIQAGQCSSRVHRPPAVLVEHDMRWYAESLATDFYSPYYRWFADRDKDYLMQKTRARYQRDPLDKRAFRRTPSLSDPVWLETIRRRGIEAARAHAPWSPVFYSLADEPGIATLAGYWDFDFSPQSLSNMRDWLQEDYGTLDALNRQWGSDFASWGAVVPDTTDQAMTRDDGNWSSWADHKAWMDTAFARALKVGADAIRTVDPGGFIGIGGAQGSGWGGYDYAKLTEVLNMFEPYDSGDNVEIIRSLAPGAAMVTTSFRGGLWEKHRVWHELLHGSRGLIVWDDSREFIGADGTLNPRGADAATYLRELRGGIATLLMNSARLTGPIAIHYSQSSMRTEWMKAHVAGSDEWADRDSSFDRKHSDFLRIRNSWCRIVEDLGLQYDFVSSMQIERGDLPTRGYRVLILPWSSSLSAREVDAILDFHVHGGLVLSDVEPGTHDEHSRTVDVPRLAAATDVIDVDILNYHRHRLLFQEEPVRDAVGAIFRRHHVEPEYRLIDDAGRNVTGVELHTFRNGDVRIAAMHTNPQLSVDELRPPRSNQRFETPARVRLVLPAPAYAVDLRRHTSLGWIDDWAGTLDPYEPVVLALFGRDPPRLQVEAPTRASRGSTAEFVFSFTPRSPAARHVLHIDTRSPTGETVEYYSGNLIADSERARFLIPFAINDEAGSWTVTSTDLLTGQQWTGEIEIY